MLLLAFLLPSALAFPTGPFPDCSESNQEACPDDLDADWTLISWVPPGSADSVRPEELAIGSGISADVAWQLTTGRWDVTVAVLDSGIEWDSGSLRETVRLNAAELPPPQYADGTEIPGGDRDGNGILTVDDYAEDPRVSQDMGVDDADDDLDASDLIAAFSDGVDDDGNGFTDDICGWDFFEDDNNPWASLVDGVAADHGTGVMRTVGAPADDGGSIGVCPNCSVLPIRVGDGFITDGDRVARALEYVAANDVQAAAMAIGALSHSARTRAAVQLADEAGVVMVGAAGDENAYHHNWPAADAPILYVHSIRGDNQDENEGTRSYFNTLNCNNVGPRLDLVSPSTACATGAVAMTAGAAGLVISAGREQGLELSTAEVRALLRMTVDDVYLPEADRAEVEAWPSQPGWDAYHGYGRLHVGRAVSDVYAGQIPPEAVLSSPEWFAVAPPTQGPLQVSGRVAAPRDSVAGWTLEWGMGQEPDTWTEAASGTSEIDGVLAEVDLSDVPRQVFEDLGNETVIERVERGHRPMVTLRLTVTDSAGRQSQDRLGVWAHWDDTLVPGFPIDLGSSLEAAPNLADLDGDGVFEIIVATSNGDLWAFNGAGGVVDGFPVATGTAMLASPAVGDLDGDGDPEIVAGNLAGELWAWHADGTPVDGFPYVYVGRAPEEFGPATAWDFGFASAPALGDIDGNGTLEIVVGGLDQRLYVVNSDGGIRDGFPLDLCQFPGSCAEIGARILSDVALGDIDGDGDLDAVIGTNEIPAGAVGAIYLTDLTTATPFPGSPLLRDGLINLAILPVIGEGHPSAVSLADVDGDGDLEIASNPMLGTNGIDHHTGEPLRSLLFTADGFGTGSNFDGGAFLTMVNNPAFGDLDGDGVPDLVYGGVGVEWLVSLALSEVVEFQNAVGAWSGATGETMMGFPRQVEDVSFLVAPAIADVTGDGSPEVLFVSGGGLAYAWNARGHLAPDWPKFTGGWMIGGPGIGDITGDGYLDFVTTTREGQLFAWRTQGPANQAVQWASNRHDPMNTGNYHTPLFQQAGPEGLDDGASGCCKKGNAMAMLWLLPLLGWSRRRRTGDRA